MTYFEIRNNKECCILYKTFHKTRLLLSLDSFIVIFNMIWNKNYRLRRHYLLKFCHVIKKKKKKSYLIKCNKCSNSNVTNMCNLSFLIWFISLCLNFIPADNYMFKVRNKKTKTRFEMLKVNNRDIRTTPMGLLWVSICYLWTYFTPCSSVSIVSSEQVNAGWDYFGINGITFHHPSSSIANSFKTILSSMNNLGKRRGRHAGRTSQAYILTK